MISASQFFDKAEINLVLIEADNHLAGLLQAGMA
jgi:hypothetical protein